VDATQATGGAQGPSDLEGLLDRVVAAARANDRTSVGLVVESVGTRSFAPLLLLAGLVILTPIVGDIPGVPMLMGVLVILVAGQLLLRRNHLWLPQWLLNRSISHHKVEKAVQWLRRPARFVDRWTRPRYTPLVRHAGTCVSALACIVVAAATPVMEVVPFSANIAGIAITAFGIALVVQDGVVAIAAILFALVTFGVVIQHLLGG
jgi:hypothetical protein